MGGPSGGVLALTARLSRRGVVLVTVATAAYVVAKAAGYQQAYPTAAARARISQLGDNPAVRMLQGVPRDLDTVGGFVAWDGGWFLESVLAVWAVLAVTRLLRADEETDRGALLAATAVRPGRSTALQVLVVAVAALLVGTASGGALLGFGVPIGGAMVFGLGLAAFGAVGAGIGAVTSQLWSTRRHAAAAAATVLASGYLLRMVANTATGAGWLRWWTPFGWMDELHAFGDPRWPALGLLVGLACALLALAARLRTRRDYGAGLLAATRRRPAHAVLRSPVGLGWRLTRGTLGGWLLGLSAYAVLMGAMLRTVSDYVAADPSFVATMRRYGIDVQDVTRGMAGFLATLLGLGAALVACWRVGSARSEESSSRADQILAGPISRTRWLAGHASLALLGVVLVLLCTGVCLWAGSRLTGGGLSAADALSATFNALPAVLVLGSIAVLLMGWRPRLTVSGSMSLATLAYLLPALGRPLSVPTWLLDLSPFQHLALVPVRGYDVPSGLVLSVIAAALVTLGFLGFARRDTVGP